jgi:hypothetical protein
VRVRPAVLAGASQDDVVRSYDIPAPVGHSLDRGLEGRILEGLDLATVVADQVMVMVAAGKGGFEARDSVAEVDALDEAESVEALERPVHTCDSDAWSSRAQAVMDLLGGQTAPLSAEEVDDCSACTPAASARLA